MSSNFGELMVLEEAIRELALSHGLAPHQRPWCQAPGILCSGPQHFVIEIDVLLSLTDLEVIEIEMPP